jgi:hypothetical protein
MRRICCAAIVATIIAFVCASGTACAQFVNGVEEFNGTSFDADTWARYTFGQGSATVSNGYLDLTGQNYLGTKTLTVGVGDTISARAMLTAATSNGTIVNLGLTATPTIPFSGQHVYVELNHTIQGESDFTFFAGSNGSATGTPHVMSNNIASWYRLQLRRTSLSDYTCELFTDAGSTIFSFNASRAGLPARAGIFIGLGPTARFDWVAVPEPGAVTWLSLVTLLCRRRHARTPPA